MKLKAAILSLVAVLLVAGVSIGGYCLWPAIEATIKNEKYYTQQDVQNSYDTGYYDGCKNGEELTGQVDYYKKLVDEYYINVNTLNGEIATLNAQKMDYERQVASLTTQKTDLEAQVANLSNIKDANETTISGLNTQIANLQKQVTALENSGADKSEQITQLNTQIAGLQNLVTQLQTTNDLHLTTINSLNEQVTSMNQQINNLNIQVYNKNSELNDLNNEILQLKKSIAYYEDYVASLENGARIVAIFEVDGSIYNVQALSANENIVVPETPVSERYVFNGWTVDGVSVDLATYEMQENTKFVADLIYNKKVSFVVDGEVYKTEYLTENNKIVPAPSYPVKEGFDFDGWSLDGVNVVDLSTLEINTDIVLYAKFTELYNVTFMLDNDVVATKTVRSGEHVTNPIVESKDGKYLNGWLLNGDLIDLKRFNVNNSLVLVANMVEPGFYKTSVGGLVTISKNNFYVSKDNEIFYLSDGYIGKFDKNTLRMTVTDFSRTDIIANRLWNLGDDIYYSYNSNQLVYDAENNAWTPKIWSGLTNFDGYNIWQFGNNVYYSSGTNQYVLNLETSTWTRKTWSGLTNFNGKNIWQYDGNVFYSDGSYHYIYNEFINKWTSFTFSNSLKFEGENIVELHGKLYCVVNTSFYVLENGQWVKVSDVPISYCDDCLFADKDDIFIFNNDFDCYRFDFLTNEWNQFVVTGEISDMRALYLLTNQYAFYSLYDKSYYRYKNLVYEFNASLREFVKTEYSLPAGFNTRTIFEWRDEYYCDANKIIYKYNAINHSWDVTDIVACDKNGWYWSDGEFLYHSGGTNLQYVYNAESNTWDVKTWNISDAALNSLSRIVKFNGNVYFGNYILNHETQEWEDAGFNISISYDSYHVSKINDNLYCTANGKWYLLNIEDNIFEEVSITASDVALMQSCIHVGDEIISCSFNHGGYHIYVGPRSN